MPLFSAIEVITMIAPPSFEKRQGLLDRKGQAPRVDRKDVVEAFFRRLGKWLRINDARPGKENINLTLLASDLGVEPIEFLELADVPLYAGDVPTDRGDGLVQFLLATGEDIDERSFGHEPLCHCQSKPAGAAGNHGN